MQMSTLGATGINVSPVGMGVLTIGKTQLKLSIEDGAEVIAHALLSGINFLDTAQYYETYPYIREALNIIETCFPDSSEEIIKNLVISSKSLCSDYDGMMEAIDACLEELGLEQIEIFLMHEVRGRYDYELRFGALNALIDAKKAGKVKTIGISTHHIDAVLKAAVDPNIDVIFPLINIHSLGIRIVDADSIDKFGTKEAMAAAIESAHKNSKGVFIMKAFGGGNIAKDYVEALDYVSYLNGVDSVMIGMGETSDVDEAIAYFEGRLPDDFMPNVAHKKIRIDQGDCEGCGSCLIRCPNKAIYINKDGKADVNYDVCITCGYCAPACPVRAIIMF
ncbi:MAG: aldo/keto reductase [Clostridiales Family XIII bacterium]|jgi:predicted aldo/keto reductase-like oxidoreductase|nr:aldo/keto reductase [Clostridiales Family XIII bacterium]